MWLFSNLFIWWLNRVKNYRRQSKPSNIFLCICSRFIRFVLDMFYCLVSYKAGSFSTISAQEVLDLDMWHVLTFRPISQPIQFNAIYISYQCLFIMMKIEHWNSLVFAILKICSACILFKPSIALQRSRIESIDYKLGTNYIISIG